MRKGIIYFSVLLFAACNNKEPQSTIIVNDTAVKADTTHAVREKKPEKTPVYDNARFREVTAKRTGENTFRITGEGQIFEANFSWIVEDGHDELLKGFEMTDAGAPDWGQIDFTITVQKKRENSTLTLILFESSAMDGSRQHELPVVLY